MLDEQIKKQVQSLTNRTYRSACQNIGYSISDITSQRLFGSMTHKEYDRKKEDLDEVYRKLLCNLPTSVLQNIITADECGQMTRKQKTIDSIATELLERELYKSEEA